MAVNGCQINSVPIPVWLNKQIIENALKQHQNDNSLQVDSVEIKPATAKGENYASLMFRCTAVYGSKNENGVC